MSKECQILRDPLIITDSSLPRRRESSDFKDFWIPAFAGMTFLEVALIFKSRKKNGLGNLGLELLR